MTIHPTPPISEPVPPKKIRRWPWPTAAGSLFLFGLIIGISTAGDTESVVPDVESRVVTIDANEQEQAALDEWEAELDEREADLAALVDELDAREDAISGAEAEAAANTVGDGIWTVGVDIEPGTYRATDVSADCYWAILVTGTNGSDIVENDIPGGGNPSVTLSEGHDFETNRCGEWTKQG
jgi:hypothetical protein